MGAPCPLLSPRLKCHRHRDLHFPLTRTLSSEGGEGDKIQFPLRFVLDEMTVKQVLRDGRF